MPTRLRWTFQILVVFSCLPSTVQGQGIFGRTASGPRQTDCNLSSFFRAR